MICVIHSVSENFDSQSLKIRKMLVAAKKTGRMSIWVQSLYVSTIAEMIVDVSMGVGSLRSRFAF